MNGEYQVSSLGTVNMMYLNDLTVGGLTAIQAQAAIQSSLEDQGFFIRDAIRVEVTILPLANSADTTNLAGNASIVVVPPPSQAVPPKAPAQVKPGETITINVEGRPELSGEYLVQPDGTIKLKGVQAEVIHVQVTGAVRSPGVIRMEGGDRRLTRALTLAGGFTVNAGHEIEVIRRGPGQGLSGFRVTRAQLDANDDTSLQDGDRVNVKVARVFFVNGEVKSQGEKMWSPGMTVGKALELAGGPTESFSLAHARIERPIKGKDGAVLSYEKIANLKMETVILPDDVLVASRKPM
jgi:protein involved in polysaccharide export with SLBB domain